VRHKLQANYRACYGQGSQMALPRQPRHKEHILLAIVIYNAQRGEMNT